MSDQSQVATPSDFDSGSETQLSLSSRSECLLAPQFPVNHGFLSRENADAQNKITQIEEKNLLLSVENEILEKYLLKVDPASIDGMDKLLEKVNENIAKSQIIVQSLEPISRAGSRTSQISKADSVHSVGPTSTFTLPASESLKIPHISYEFRHDIVSREMNSMKSKLNNLIVKMRRQKSNITACLEEVAIRIKDLTEYTKKLMLLSKSDSKSKINVGVYIGFMRGVLKQIIQNINQAKTNKTILSIEKKKVLLRMEDKEELSSTIYAIDFDVLEIQNQELRKLLHQKCHCLALTKRSLGSAEKSLTASVNLVDSLSQELNSIRKHIKLNRKKLVNLRRKRKKLESEIKQKRKEALISENYVIKSSGKSTEALDVVSYALTKLCVNDLERKLKISSRKHNLKLGLLSCVRHHFKVLTNQSNMTYRNSRVL
nr:PREDICTED: uncharacterized protein LOC109044360 isoform X1 [Bemisia tabaci]